MHKRRSFPIFEMFIAILFFVMLHPSFTWGIDVTYIQYFLLSLMFFMTDWKRQGNIGLMVFFAMVMMIIPITHGTNINGFISYVLLTFVLFTKRQFALQTFYLFKKILVIVTFVSILTWLLVVIVKIDIPHTIVKPLNDLKSYTYSSYPFLIVPNGGISITSFIRFHCVFDEPGAVGTYSLLMLYLGNFNMKKFDNIVFMVAGIISFSLFFYASVLVFMLPKVFVVDSLKKYRYWAIAGVTLFFFSIMTIPVLNEMVGARLQYDTDRQTIVGNNRSDVALDNYVESIKGTDVYYWGDNNEVNDEFANYASFNNAILRFGMVFIVLYYVFFFFYAKNRLGHNIIEVLLFVLLLFLTLYQRPGYVNPAYLFMFASILLVREKDKEVKVNKIISQK